MIRLWPFGRRKSALSADPAADKAPPRPDRLTYVIGDVHGCLAPLEALLHLIEEDRGGRPADLVFVGDYADRGPDSPGALRRLMALQSQDPGHVHCLLGNHDQMLLDFIDHGPEAMRWLEIGGFDTLVNFNVSHLRGNTPAERHAVQSAALAKALGPDLVQWLRDRPLWWQSGDLVAVHALTQPDLPMDAQPPAVLLWSRPTSDLRPRDDGLWVVHGHTIVRTPRIRAGHVAIDTGAYRGKSLTAGVFDGGPIRFLSVSAEDMRPV